MKEKKLLFVCLGNICRSPAAEGVMKHVIDKANLSKLFKIDSAGTNGYHDGEMSDPRMLSRAKARGYNLTSISRKINPSSDFSNFDMIIAMDDSNVSNLKKLSPSIELQKKIYKMTDFCSNYSDGFVPDPYYGDLNDFDNVLDILEDACNGLLKYLSK